ncbi:MAG: efflux RND transporter periplasmic adaptor subunit [Acidobacteriota bacterium]|nr:efflux RND transporter periplasmic adaptor subunit [Acidobacteriota bacterium]MDH3784401.1 efflux RND transporter periplasmic adaptor subunit [Acidobacteriota bacterium]
MKSVRFAVIVISVVTLFLLAGCGGGEELPAQPEVARQVKLLTVGGMTGGSEVSFPGRVAAGEQVDLAFRVGGPLIELPVQEGEKVSKGQVVAKIDPRDFRIKVNSAQATYDKAEADIERLAALYEKDAASKAQLDQARASRDVTRATLDDARADLSDTRLRAPFAAHVGEKFIENFQDVQAKQPVLSLVGIDTIEIQVDLPESIIARLRTQRTENAKAFAKFDAAPGQEFPLELTEMATQADPLTQTYQATLVMPQPDGVNILPGMTAEVIGRVPVSEGDDAPIIVPAVAVAAGDAGSAFVWVVDSDAMTVSRRDVTTGDLVGSDQIELTDGLGAGETIAISAVSRLREGMTIRKLEN